MAEYPRQILQITPADGWYAAYSAEAHEDVSKFPLVCWALVESSYSGVGRTVEGMLAAGGGLAKDRANFVGYTKNASTGTIIDPI